MDIAAAVLIPLGFILLLGLAAEAIGRNTRLPRITMLILLGIFVGPSGIGLIGETTASWYPLVADMALAMIGFLLGGKLTRQMLASQGRQVFWVSGMMVIITLIIVAAGLWLVGVPPALALLLGAIATATDPAATNEVIREYKARGPFSRLLQGVVALDDAWGLIAFSLVLVLAQLFEGGNYHSGLLLHGFWELAGAVLVGCLLGVPMAFLTGRIHANEPTLVEALGMVFLCAGLSIWLEVSYLLAAVTMGAVVVNLAPHHNRPFHAIEDIEWPFVILFFVLSGASLSVEALTYVGWVGAAYLLLRVVARLIGARLVTIPSWCDAPRNQWVGAAMLPQAGVAMAMAFVSAQLMPQYQSVLLTVVVVSTVVFELIGPVATRMVLFRLGEAGGEGVESDR
ncbi:cation:proton antiporter [Porticoccaceae bacterium LTM1]|nr:cation:proton antiporter [Porticoccaceae bacterium LTM1]